MEDFEERYNFRFEEPVEPIYRHFLGRSKNRCDSKKKLVRKSEFAKNSKRESSLKRN